MSFVVSPKLILPPYFLTFIAYSYSSANTITVGVRVGVRVKIKIKVKVEVKIRVKVKVKVKVKIKDCIYILYSLRAYKVFLARLLFS